MANLWAVAYDEVAHAERLCIELMKLDSESILQVQDLLIVQRRQDSTFKFRREEYRPASVSTSGGALGILVGAMLIQPRVGRGMGALAAMQGPAVRAFFGNIAGVLPDAGVASNVICLSSNSDC